MGNKIQPHEIARELPDQTLSPGGIILGVTQPTADALVQISNLQFAEPARQQTEQARIRDAGETERERLRLRQRELEIELEKFKAAKQADALATQAAQATSQQSLQVQRDISLGRQKTFLAVSLVISIVTGCALIATLRPDWAAYVVAGGLSALSLLGLFKYPIILSKIKSLFKST